MSIRHCKSSPIRKRKTGLVFCFQCVTLFGLLSAQQTPYTAFYRQNWSLVNPAAVDPWSAADPGDWNRTTMFSVGFRQQGIDSDIEAAPVQGAAAFEITPDLRSRNLPGIYKGGFAILKDRAASISTLGVYGTFSYGWRAGTEGLFNIGAAAGWIQYGADRSALQNYDPGDPVINDAGMRWQPDFSIGVFYRNNSAYAGLSMPQTLSNFISSSRKPHVYLLAGKMMPLHTADALFEPSIWLRWTPGLEYESIRNSLPFSADLNARFWISAGHEYQTKRRKIWFGSGIGTVLNLNLETGVEILRMREAPGHNLSGQMQRIRIGMAGSFPIFSRRGPLGKAVEVTAAFAFN